MVEVVEKSIVLLTEINQLMVHWWFGLLVWILGVPEIEGDCYGIATSGYP